MSSAVWLYVFRMFTSTPPWGHSAEGMCTKHFACHFPQSSRLLRRQVLFSNFTVEKMEAQRQGQGRAQGPSASKRQNWGLNQVHLLSGHSATTHAKCHVGRGQPFAVGLGPGSSGVWVHPGGWPGAHTHLQEQPHHLGLAVQRGLVQRRARLGLAVDLNSGSQELPVEARGVPRVCVWRAVQERKPIAGGRGE